MKRALPLIWMLRYVLPAVAGAAGILRTWRQILEKRLARIGDIEDRHLSAEYSKCFSLSRVRLD